MKVNSNILQAVMEQSAKGFCNYQIEPILIEVLKDEQQVSFPEILPQIEAVGAWNFIESNQVIKLDNDILILTSDAIDIPLTATLTLESFDNLFTTGRTAYQNLSYSKHQIFSDFLKISLKNYDEFIPFYLEFLRVTPMTT